MTIKTRKQGFRVEQLVLVMAAMGSGACVGRTDVLVGENQEPSISGAADASGGSAQVGSGGAFSQVGGGQGSPFPVIGVGGTGFVGGTDGTLNAASGGHAGAEPGTGPVPVFHCAGEIGAFPAVCQLGMAPVYEVECQVSPSLKFYFLLASRENTPLNQPLDFSQLPRGTGNVQGIHGQITFLEANFVGRTFTARFTNVSFDRTLSDGTVQLCMLDDGIIGGIPGEFL